jgi:hypothetical protein
MSGSPYRTRDSVARVSALRVVVAEDQLLLREGLSRLLTDAGFDVVAGPAAQGRRTPA